MPDTPERFPDANNNTHTDNSPDVTLGAGHGGGVLRRGLPDSVKHRLMEKYGIPPSDAEEAGLFWATPEEIYRLTGVRVNCGGVGIPYPGEPDGFCRFRLDEPVGDMKYVSPRSAGCRLYVPPRADLAAPEVVITEGELKALCAAARGINCVAVGGIDSWRNRSAAGERLPADEALLGRLNRDWTGQRVVLVYDSDIDQRHERWVAFPELAEQLYRLGAEEVKVVTLPKLEAVHGKVGLDDYLLAYERAGEDGAARFRSLVGHAPAWLPVGAGAEAFAARELASGDIERQILGAAALLGLLQSEPVVKARLKRAGITRYHKDILDGAKRVLAQARERQEPRRPPEPRGPEGGSVQAARTIAELFPPAAGTPFAGFPVPQGWTIDDLGRICTQAFDKQTGAVEADPVVACVVALGGVMVPADEGEDTVYDLWWYKDGWNRAQATGGTLFNVSKAVDFLANLGLPVDSTNIVKLIKWLGAMRDRTFTDPGRALPLKVLVTRSGWHRLDGRHGAQGEMFAVGRDILTPAGDVQGEAGEDPDAPESDHPLSEWSSGIGAGEKQMLAAISTRGTLENQIETYLKYFRKYPLAAFFTGAGAAGPLMRYLVEEGESDVCGFVVETTDPESGRGKTTLNMFPAGLWGKPTLGDMIRTASRTTVHSEILFSVHCDISAHIDESQLVRYADAVAEIVYSLALGMGKERGAKSGGSRKTRRWRSVLIVSAERSVLDVVRGRQGVFDRVLSFPPLFPAKREEYRREAERIARDLTADYGHLGRHYVRWLLSFPEDARRRVVLGAYNRWKEALDLATDDVCPVTGDPSDGSAEKNQTLKRLAKRAAACAAGLELLLRSIGLSNDEALDITTAAVEAAWGHIVENTEGRALLAAVLDVLRSFVAENRELIDGLREGEGRPPRWVGKVVYRDGRKYIALFSNAVREALKRNADVEYETAVKALKAAGLLWLSERNKKEQTNLNEVRFGGAKKWCLLVDADALLDGDVWQEQPGVQGGPGGTADGGFEDGLEL